MLRRWLCNTVAPTRHPAAAIPVLHYDHKAVEAKWQRKWEERQNFKVI